jgi:hypothetical protein
MSLALEEERKKLEALEEDELLVRFKWFNYKESYRII